MEAVAQREQLHDCDAQRHVGLEVSYALTISCALLCQPGGGLCLCVHIFANFHAHC